MSERYINKAIIYAESCSYRIAVSILNDITGSKEISIQSLNNLINKKALDISDDYVLDYTKSVDLIKPKINCTFDIYDKSIKETIIEIDGILSKKQKYLRDKIPRSKKEFIVNDICILQTKDGYYRYIIAPINEKGDNIISLSECINFSLKKEKYDSEINIISISDGATDIRQTLKSSFGENIQIILDWYHICKKTREFLSMISKDKESKIKHLKYMLNMFWTGQVDNAINYLKNLDSKNHIQKEKFLKYLEKHKLEIINYEKRKKSGKTIGSGRVEKAVDQVIGSRQKKKGMSWSQKGSKSLGILKVDLINKNMQKYKPQIA